MEHWMNLAPILRVLIVVAAVLLAGLLFHVLLGSWKAGVIGVVPVYVLGIYALADLPAVVLGYAFVGVLATMAIITHNLFWNGNPKEDAKPNDD